MLVHVLGLLCLKHVKPAPETYETLGFHNYVSDVSLVIVIVFECLLMELSCLCDATL
jgi:hypothetical protein